MADYNSMQANLGLIPGAGPSVQIKSPAQAAAELSQQASLQMQQAQQTMPVARPVSAMFTFGQQYQQQFQAAQAQSSYGPYAANMLASFTQPSALPSPLMMTPAHTGVFRPPMPYGSSMGAPVSPMPVMPLLQTPFTPQLPVPTFRTPWEQEVQQRELRSDQLYSMLSQVPRFGGMAAGYGIGALAGAAVGGRFGGAAGRGVGAVLGGVSAHISGLASGMGQMAMWPMRPGIEAREMGLSAQRMSQDWVVGGPNLHPLGQGLSRDASMSLGRGIQGLAENRGFRNETRGMFNRFDLMNIMEQSGKAGLMDFDQGINQIQDRLRQVSRTVSRFMELTNDPDVTSVIKRMGQLRSFGLSMPEIEQAASSMRTYAKAAGTTVGGIWQQGLPGAMTYQALGLSGGAGMQYGMYSAATARQAVASGTYTEAQLAMLGGVQGVAQRNMQAQGAMMSMPLFGAAVSSYGAGGWGLSGGGMANVSRGGPQNMVMGAVGNMNAAVQAGGIGALALMPLQQQQIADQAARAMSPYEQTAMRFNMARQAGQFLGLKGAGGFAAGARLLYGDEVAQQMLLEASNPQYWKSQKRMIQSERDTLARQQRQEIIDAAPGFFGGMGLELSTAVGLQAERAMDPLARAGGAISRGWRNAITRPLQELADREAGAVTFDRLEPGMSADLSSPEGRRAFKSRQRLKAKYGRNVKMSGDIQMSGQQALEAFMRTGMGDEAGDLSGFALGAVPWALGPVAGGVTSGLELAGFNVSGMAKEALGNVYLAFANRAGGHHRTAIEAVQARDARINALFEGAANKRTYGKEASALYSGLEKSLGITGGEGRWAVAAGGRAIARAAGAAQGIAGGYLSEESMQQAMASGIAMRTGKSQDEVLKALKALPEDQYSSLMQTGLGHAGKVGTDAERAIIQATQDRARGNMMRGSLSQSRAEMDAVRGRMRERTRGWGLTEGGGGEMNQLIGKYDTSQLMGIMVNIAGKQGNSKEWERALIEEIKRNNPGMSDAEAQDLASKTTEDVGTGSMSESLRRQLQSLVSVGGRGIREFRSQIADVTNLQESEYTTSAVAGIGREVGSTFGTARQVLGMGAGDLKKLGKSAKYKGLAGMIGQYQKATGAQREELQAQIMEQLVSLGEETGGSQSTSIPTGDKARQLSESEKTISETADKMSEAFKYFNSDTTKTFQQAVNIFHETVTAQRLQEGKG